MEFTYTEAKSIIEELGRFTVEKYDYYGLTTIETESGEYAIGTDAEADAAWELALDSYLDEVIYPELVESVLYYFDDEKWKSDARYDGRGHALSSYDGDEIEVAGFIMFRIN